MKKYFLLVITSWFILFGNLKAQEDLPTDYLTASFHAGRREALRAKMPEHSVAVVFAYPERVYSRDVDYPYHPNPDLFYLTGYKEPHALLLIFKDEQSFKGTPYHNIFFVQKRDSASEMWTGKRLGAAGVQSSLGIPMTFDGSDFKNFKLDLIGQKKILMGTFPSGLIDDAQDSADIFDLVEQFKEKAGFPKDYDYELSLELSYLPLYNRYFSEAEPYLKRRFNSNEKYKSNPVISAFMSAKDSAERNKVILGAGMSTIDFFGYATLMNQLRGIKTSEEMDQIRKAVSISCYGHREAMKAANISVSERQIQGIHEFVHKQYGAEEVGYGSIVGAGDNACILHYEENNKMHLGNNQLLLMDVGAAYHGYSADVTRTIPANGKFTAEQKKIYDLVYAAQEEIFTICREGIPFDSLQNRSKQVLAKGLMELGIISKPEEVGTYYPHGCSHHMGLDVHDRGQHDSLLYGMVITVEPGIYIPQNSACDKKWWGIGVRIEDDVMIKKDGYELLSELAPRKSADVEKMMKEKSALEDISLPALK